jgi:hypothetical protein
MNEFVNRIHRIVEGTIVSACGKEAARTREWFERTGLPKAARVAQREAYNVLRAHGLIEKSNSRGALVGSGHKGGEVASAESREETVRLCVELATTVHGVGLDEFLDEYVRRGEMAADEAHSIIREATEMGLLRDRLGSVRHSGLSDSRPVT